MFYLKIKENKLNWKMILSATILSYFLMFVGYATIEPSISKAVTDTFLVTQSVTSEISFSTAASDITMSGSLSGVSGGVSNGNTQVGILTNDSAGYNLSIKSTSTPSMQGLTQGGTIADYTPAGGGVPDYTYSVPTGAEFAYTVSASTTADLDQSFKDDTSSTCNTGSADTGGSSSCWLNASTTDERIVYRTTETASTSEKSTLYFRVTINNGSFIVEDTYQATIVLTALTN